MSVTLLDGGMGQELIRRADGPPTKLWSLKAMLDGPGMVTQVHRDFIEAGADVITTNSYMLLEDRLAMAELSDRYAELLETSLSAAETARADRSDIRIAGSLGPLGGSYRPDLTPDPAETARRYARLAAGLAPRCDLLIFETLPSLDAVEGALIATAQVDLPVWIAVSVADEDGTRLRSGEPVADIATRFDACAPEALLINCSPPEVIGDALDILSGTGLPLGAYANGFTSIAEGFLQHAPTVDALTSRHDLTPARYAEFATDWIARGASIVGGCCEVGPAHIAEIAARLSQGAEA